MKALLLRQHGGLENLEVVTDKPIPQAVEGHVVIRVRASSFNYHDVFTMRGMPGIKVPLPVVIGLDMAGEISEVGAGVTGWKAGDRVLVNPVNKKKGLMGEMLDGGMAEYCLVAADQLVAMPAGVTFEEAASLPVAYGTAHRMIVTHNTIKKGDKVIILGASGGVGTGCVILCKLFGAEVISCTSSPEKVDALKKLGSDEVLNIKETDFSKWAVEKYGKPQRRTYDGGVDVVINFTGGDTWHPSLRCLKRGGKLLVCGATAGYDPKEDLRYIWSFELNIIGSNSFYDEDLKGLMALIAEGKMKPVIDKVLPLEQARRGPAPDPGPRGHRQGRGGAVEFLAVIRGAAKAAEPRDPRSRDSVPTNAGTRTLADTSGHDESEFGAIFMSDEITLEKAQAPITRAPYHQWLGLKVIAMHDDGIELTATWREEWVVNPERRYTHGGILAALVDLAADWAMLKKLGRPVPTIDLRVDYHAAAMPGDLTAKGKVVRQGGQFSCAEAYVYDKDGKLLASGRGTYFTAPPPPPKGVIETARDADASPISAT